MSGFGFIGALGQPASSPSAQAIMSGIGFIGIGFIGIFGGFAAEGTARSMESVSLVVQEAVSARIHAHRTSSPSACIASAVIAEFTGARL
jgi:hypothetical protein